MGTKTRMNRLLTVSVVALVAGVWSFTALVDTAWAKPGGDKPGGGKPGGGDGGEAPQYTLVPLGSLGGDLGGNSDINDAGQVAGFSTTISGNLTACLVTPEEDAGNTIWFRDDDADGANDLMLRLDLDPMTDELEAYAADVNNLGEVVGLSYEPYFSGDNNPYIYHAFVFAPDQDVEGNWLWFRDSDGDGLNDFMVDLGFLATFTYEVEGWTFEDQGTAYAVAINDLGQIVGHSWGALDEWHSFVITPDINANGEKVWTQMNGRVNELMVDLGPDLVIDINNAGQLLGGNWVITPEIDAVGDFVYYRDDDGDGLNDLKTLLPRLEPGRPRSAGAINNVGQVVGSALDRAYKSHAVRWDPDTAGGFTIVDLGVVKGAFTSPTSINDAGQVVGEGTVHNWRTGLTSCTGFLWQDGTMFTVDQLLSGVEVPENLLPLSINESGIIAASAGAYTSDMEPVLLVPVPATP